MHRSVFLRMFTFLLFMWVFRLATASAAPPTFSRDVAPILFGRCVSCHRPGQIGPMPLLTYAQARPWAKAIRDEVFARNMPPWRADPAHGRFANDPRLSAREVETIVRWADAGAPEGDHAQLPPTPHFASEWAIGKPDADLTPDKAFAVPATGDLPLQYFLLPLPSGGERWITAAEIRPGARTAVHHATVYIAPPADGELPPDPGWATPCDRATPPPMRTGPFARDYLFSWSPGSPPFVAPAGGGRRIPAGARLVLEVHYTTTGRATTDLTHLGVVFARRPATHLVDTVVAQNRKIVIAPGDPDYRASACVELKRPVTLLELKPHMHRRGRAMSFTLVEPTGRREVLLSVPDWSFDWQLAYKLKSPRHLAAGTRIVVDARYDNSAANKANPAPEMEVHWDEWWLGEMLAGMITLVDE
jgi:hypothetical protein